jgi:hypothetical protein
MASAARLFGRCRPRQLESNVNVSDSLTMTERSITLW